MRRAERAVARRAITRAADSRLAIGGNRLIGGGEGDMEAPGGHCIRANPPPFLGRILYSAEGRNYAPPSPEGAVVGASDGYANNCLFHSLSQILSGDRPESGACSAIRERCAPFRDALVAKYGCGPFAELEMQLRRRLIVEDLGGRSVRLECSLLVWQ